jgi:hypothetical protein
MPPTGYASTTAEKNCMAFSRKRCVSALPYTQQLLLAADNAFQRLSGASLLVFANKTDVQGCMTGDEMRKVG